VKDIMTEDTKDINAIQNALSKKSLSEFINAWTQKKEHYTEFYNKTLRLAKKYLNEEETFNWAKHLATKRETRNIACHVFALGNPYSRHEKETKHFLLDLGNDERWETRESAAYAFSNVLLKNFNEVYPQFQEWVTNGSGNIRRAVALATKYVSKARKSDYGEPLLRLVEHLLSDKSIYVRRNLGSFAIGDGILRAYPKLTMQYIEKWSHSPDEQVLWNVAMIFTSAESAKHCDEALPILRKLATDDRRFVWRAVASALRNLGRRHPEKVKPELQRWLKDEKRKKVAETALSFINRRKQA